MGTTNSQLRVRSGGEKRFFHTNAIRQTPEDLTLLFGVCPEAHERREKRQYDSRDEDLRKFRNPASTVLLADVVIQLEEGKAEADGGHHPSGTECGHDAATLRGIRRQKQHDGKYPSYASENKRKHAPTPSRVEVGTPGVVDAPSCRMLYSCTV